MVTSKISAAKSSAASTLAASTLKEDEKQKRSVTLQIIDFPDDWREREEISCLVVAKSFPHPSKFPDDPNPRQANTESKVYKKMIQTLKDTPERFHLKNAGVYIFADIADVKIMGDQKFVTFTFNPKPKDNSKILGQGHVDGRHTMLALRAAEVDLEHVLVRLIVRVGVMPTREDRMAAIERQDNYAIDLPTRKNAAGAFDLLKAELLRNERTRHLKIAYVQGEPGVSTASECGVGFLLQRVGMLDPKYYFRNPGDYRFPTTYAASLGSKYDKLIDNAVYLVDLIPDILHLENMFWSAAKADYANTQKKVPGFKYGHELQIMSPDPQYIVTGMSATRSAVLPILSAFRVFLHERAAKSQYAWVIPFNQLNDEGKPASETIYRPLIKRLWNYHKGEIRSLAEVKDWVTNPLGLLHRSEKYWHNLHATAEQYLHSLPEFKGGHKGWKG